MPDCNKNFISTMGFWNFANPVFAFTSKLNDEKYKGLVELSKVPFKNPDKRLLGVVLFDLNI